MRVLLISTYELGHQPLHVASPTRRAATGGPNAATSIRHGDTKSAESGFSNFGRPLRLAERSPPKNAGRYTRSHADARGASRAVA
jgi:hypothetical protein